MHDTAGEIAQPFDVKDWKKGEIDPIPGKTMPAVTVVERDYPNLYKRFTSLGPLMDKLGNGGKGMSWNTDHEVELLKKLNGVVTEEGAEQGACPHRQRDRRLRGHPDAGAGDQWRGRGQGLGVARKASPAASTRIWPSRRKTRRSASATSSRSRARSSPRRSGPASRVGEGLLQRRLHQRPRTDPVADADRPPAALPGSSVDARLRRGLLRLPAADRHQDRQAGDRPQAERQHAGRAELHHAAPEVGHPLHLHRQSADADAVARRADRLDQRDRRQEAPASSTTTGSRPSTPTARWWRARWSPSASSRACA